MTPFELANILNEGFLHCPTARAHGRGAIFEQGRVTATVERSSDYSNLLFTIPEFDIVIEYNYDNDDAKWLGETPSKKMLIKLMLLL